MANYYDIMEPILEHFRVQVEATVPLGDNMPDFEFFESELDLVGNANRERLFDVQIDKDEPPGLPNLYGAGTVDYEVPVNIDISYLDLKANTAAAYNDLENIREKIRLSDTSALTGYEVSWVRDPNVVWLPSNDETTKYRYMRIPYMVRIKVTH